MPEINFTETTNVRDKVFFKGAAQVSEAEAAQIKLAQKEAEEGAPAEDTETESTSSAPKAKGKK
jgi:hypothetical protein